MLHRQPNYAQHAKVLGKCPLFLGLKEQEIYDFLGSIGARILSCGDLSTIIGQGERVENIGVLLSGVALAHKLTLDGREILAAKIMPSALFADLLAASKSRHSPVQIVAASDCEYLQIPLEALISHNDIKIKTNLIRIFSDKFFELFGRIDCLSAGSIEEKIFIYLFSFNKNIGGRGNFDVPHSRTQMAEYMNVDRSALSRKLAELKKSGKIDYYKNTFSVLNAI